MHPIEHLRFVARALGAAPTDVLIEESAAALIGFASEPAALVTASRRLVARHLHVGAMWNLCAHLLCAPDPAGACASFVASINSDTTASHLADQWEPSQSQLWVGWNPTLARALSQRPDLDVWVSDCFGSGSQFASALQRHELEVSTFDPSGLGQMSRDVELTVIEASAVCSSAALCEAGSLAAAATAAATDTPVWLVAPAGAAVAQATFDAMAGRLAEAAQHDGGGPWSGEIDEVPMSLIDHVVSPDGLQRVAGGTSQFTRTDGPTAHELHRADIT